MKKLLTVGVVLCAALMLFGCKEKRIVHCDGCGKEIKVDADSDTTEDWIILCDECQKKLYEDE